MSLETQLQSAQARIVEINDEIDAITAVAETEGRDLSDDDQQSIIDRTNEFQALEGRIEKFKATIEAKDKITASRITTDLMTRQDESMGSSEPMAALPARVRATKSKYFSSTRECYDMGMWLGASIMRNGAAKRYCREHGIGEYRNAMEEGTDSLGGYSVPDPLAATIIELIELYGVYRQYSRNVAMTSDTLAIPQLDPAADGTGQLTVYYPAEGAALTASDLTFGSIGLVAKKYAQLAIMSTELNEDSVISMTDLLARDMARQFAHAEDLNSFLGDGTATYGGITGIQNALQAGAVVTGAATIGALTLADFEDAAGRLKEYPGLNPTWFMSRYCYYNSVIPLLNALGGTDMRQVEAGGMQMFLGYPVQFTQVLPGLGATTGDMVAVLGDLDLGAYMGTRRQVSIRTLNELYAANDQIGIMGTLRSDSVVHSVGTATGAGCIVSIVLGA